MKSSSIKCLLQNGLQSYNAKSNFVMKNIMPRTSCSKIANGLCYDKQIRSVRMAHSMTQTNWVSNRDESRELMGLWPDIVRDLTEAGRNVELEEATKWMSKILQYNVPNGKKNRALSLVYAFRKMARPEDLTEDNFRLARILGWCTELFQAFFLIEDDVMDGSKSRRGQPCWYLQNNVGLRAINDGIMLQESVYHLLNMHFKNHKLYINLVDTFHETAMRTSLGQTLDLLSTDLNNKPNLNLFTMDRYNAIVKYKTAYYSFVLPVSLAMYFTGVTDPEMHRQATTILLEMGHFFQVQDDYLDCYGDPNVTGKIGRDIEEGKCSWLVVVALQRVTPSQREILTECYGSSDPDKVARVKQLYEDIGLPGTYAIYEEESYNLMNTHIQQISRGLPHDLFFTFLSKIYRRDS